MITDKIPTEMSIEELYHVLCKTYHDVEITGKNSLCFTYYDTKLNILKKKKGFDVSPDIPGYVLWVITVIVMIALMILNNKFNFGNEVSSIVGTIIGMVIGSLIWACPIYWIYAEIFVLRKEETMREFCESLNL